MFQVRWWDVFGFLVLICKLISNVPLPSIFHLLQVWETDDVVPATLLPNYKLSWMRSWKTLILGLIPESNLLKILGFQSLESRQVIRNLILVGTYIMRHLGMTSPTGINSHRYHKQDRWENGISGLDTGLHRCSSSKTINHSSVEWYQYMPSGRRSKFSAIRWLF